MKPQIVQVYSNTFTTDELTGIIAFYKSPSGQALLEKRPGLMNQCSAVAQRQIGDVMSEIKHMIDEFIVNLKSGESVPASEPEKN